MLKKRKSVVDSFPNPNSVKQELEEVTMDYTSERELFKEFF